jgi:hypothetical protein
VFFKEGGVLKGRGQLWKKESADGRHNESGTLIFGQTRAEAGDLTLVSLLELWFRGKVRHGVDGGMVCLEINCVECRQ